MLTRPTRVYRRPAPDPIAKEWTATGRQRPPQLPAGDGKSRIPRSGPWSTDLRVEPGLLVVVERGVVQGGVLKRYRVDHGIEPVDHGFETAVGVTSMTAGQSAGQEG